MTLIKVLFVCLGNICRSPMAEAVLRHMANKRGLGEVIKVDSAGTGRWHIGEPPHPGTRKLLKRKGISDSGIFARLLRPGDADEFDYVIAMDEENLRDIRSLCKKDNTSNIYLLAHFLPGRAWPHGRHVPDPWYTGDFEETYRLVSEGCEALLLHIEKEDLG